MALKNIITKLFGNGREKDLENDLQRLYSAVESSSNHIILTDVDGKITYANTAAQQITGYSFEEMKGKTPRLWGGRMPKEFYQNLWHVIKEEGKPFIGEIENQRKNGEVYTAIIHVSQVYEDGKLVGFIGTEEDISSEKNTEKLLAEEKAKLEASMLSIGYGLVLTDKKGEITMVNDSFTKMLNWSSADVMGRKLLEVIPMLGKDKQEVPIFKKLIEDAILNKVKIAANSHEEIYYVRKDGTLFPVYITVSPILYKGESIGAVEVFRDITKEKEIEEAKTEFLSLASHQLRTPLSVINWYLELINNIKTTNLTVEQHKYLSEVSRASHSMVDLVNALLNISRFDLGTFKFEMECIKPAEIVEGVLKELNHSIENKNLEIKIDVAKDLSFISDASIFKIILQNLISNAVKYTKDSTVVSIKIGAINDKISIQVTDQGYGIPEDQKNCIFTKMFRARNIKDKVSEGTGVGLYLVKKVIESLKGEITFESKEDVGTTFSVNLPK
jgi:PAS domain S-box-containing protein